MSALNKILTLGLACGVVLSFIGQAQAAKETSSRDTVIFRIENIKPLENEEGMTSQCEFYFTVYNRMERAIKEASIDLSWIDNVAEKYKVVGDKLEVQKDPKKVNFLVSKTVNIKDVAPHQQKSFKEIVDTDKCHVLFDQVEYRVDDCIAEGDEIKIKNNKKEGKGSCSNSFDYINSQNPEYYSEFKDVPESELQQITEQQNKQDLQAIEDVYKSSMETLKKASDTLKEIK